MSESSLALFTRASQMLAEADTIQKSKELLDLSLTAADWDRSQGMGEDAIDYCRGYALEAERRMGQLLMESDRARGTKTVGGGTGAGSAVVVPPAQPPTLSALGLSKKMSAQAQQLAALPEREFAAIKTGKTTRAAAKRKAKEDNREARRAENRIVVASVPALEAAATARFATIVIDPPWDWGDEGDVNQLGRAKPDYATLSHDKLLALPVGDKADVDSHIYLWITNRSLPKGFSLLEAWGFRYITALTWVKPSFGMGNYFRGQTEQILFGVKGSQFLKRKNAGTVFYAPRGPNGHSSKPTEFYDFVESCSPGPYLEIFSRQNRDGWVAWGESA